MTAGRRWGYFLCVGALGVVVQFGSLLCLHRVLRGGTLVISLAALELTLLHNFAWHSHLTWRDRQTNFRTFLRFQLSSGAISWAGTLVVVGWLAKRAHWPLIAANLVAVGCCSVANFLVADHWSFGRVLETRVQLRS